MKPIISILMGVYNAPNPERLQRAIRSLRRQTFRRWELILYDDGSRETDSNLIRQAASSDARILYIRASRNRGLAHALNVCLRCASGAYVARMDDDDIALPTRLHAQYRFLRRHPQFHWVGSSAELCDSSGVWGFQKMPAAPTRQDFLFNSPYIHPSVMFRREVLLRAGGYNEAARFRGCEDYELFMRLCRKGYRGYNLPQPLLQYFEDYRSHQKRTYARRIREMRLRYHGFQSLGFSKAGTFYYVIKPLLVGMIPAPVHHYIRRKMKKNRHGKR